MRKGDTPPGRPSLHACHVRESRLQKGTMIGMRKEALAEQQQLSRRIEAHEFDVSTVGETIKKPRADRRAPGCLLPQEALLQKKIVQQLLAVVIRLGLIAIMVA